VTRPLLAIAGVTKDYRGLRPFRIRDLTVSAGESVAIVGFDQPSAEVLVNLVTGATVPDEGDVTVFGRSTREIADSADWLSVVDRIGIVTPRAVLLDSLSVLQNLAMPFTLDVEPLTGDVRARAARLADEVEIGPAFHDVKVGSLDAATTLRVRVARACALDPQLLVLEHASAGLEGSDAEIAGALLRRIAATRGAAVVAATADDTFARAVAARVVRWEPATGRLAERRGWFRGRLG
jgi:ABC-type transporter Mla maintaining outer membrane lipid asymmetry ATPase subunit MlaF